MKETITLSRVLTSLRLFSEGAGDVAVVARRAGFSSELTFRRNFKDVLGYLPSEAALMLGDEPGRLAHRERPF